MGVICGHHGRLSRSSNYGKKRNPLITDAFSHFEGPSVGMWIAPDICLFLCQVCKCDIWADPNHDFHIQKEPQRINSCTNKRLASKRSIVFG